MTETAATSMRAVVRTSYGVPAALPLRQVPRPGVDASQLLVRIRACSVNRIDWYEATGTPWVARPMTGLRRPKSSHAGHDFSGTVEAVGDDVGDLHVGDDVFGMAVGAFAEFVAVERAAVSQKPADVDFEKAAAVPLAGLTALQGLRDDGELRPGQRVLVNGASGGVGTFAVQLARVLGAEVTAVCSTGNVERARSLGAAEVVDYTRDDFTRGQRRFDVILDVSGTRSWSDYRRVLTPRGRLVIIGAPGRHRALGPLGHIARLRLAARSRGDQTAVFFIAKSDRADLEFLRDQLASGAVTPVLARRYEISEIADALRHLGEGHARGKIVVRV